jgi:hypothetical protein
VDVLAGLLATQRARVLGMADLDVRQLVLQIVSERQPFLPPASLLISPLDGSVPEDIDNRLTRIFEELDTDNEGRFFRRLMTGFERGCARLRKARGRRPRQSAISTASPTTSASRPERPRNPRMGTSELTALSTRDRSRGSSAVQLHFGCNIRV